MQQAELYYVGLDVDDNKFHGFAISAKTGEAKEFTCQPTLGALKKALLKFGDPQHFKICYEATYLGFFLCRGLRKSGFQCDVIAPSLIPKLGGDKVKTDRLDAEKLARYFLSGMLTIVNVPDEEREADRNLLRSRKFIQEQLSALKKHINSITRAVGWDYKREENRKQIWRGSYLKWLHQKLATTELTYLKIDLEILLKQYENLIEIMKRFDFELQNLSQKPIYKQAVQALTCFRGIETLTALVLVTEIGDARRFKHPRQLTSYAGMDIVERSSGGKERRFGISRDGNKFIRTAVIEACQRSEKAVVGRELKKRREGVDQKYIDIADRCLNRLRQKSQRLLARDKTRNKVKVACAREMLGFIWETLRATAA